MRILRRFLPALSLGILLTACGSQVTVTNPSIPEPMIDKLPMKVAGRYPLAFNNFVHEERVIGKEKWTIQLGASNRMLFDQLFNSMFTDYQVIGDNVDPRDIGVDALIEPSIDAFEFSVPNQSQTEEFAVWIRYRIKIFDSEGNQVANWPIAAYGKSQTTTFGGDTALRRAAVLAMRDAAALIILQMDKATGISRMVATARNRNEAPAPEDSPLTSADVARTTAVEEKENE